MTTAQNPAGPWAPLHLVKAAKGWIDPCPFWDEDGQAYLVHAFANSRCGIKHKLNMCRLSPDGTALMDDGEIVFDGTVNHPTMEGPKLYKRNGYYYIFAPAGGVRTGLQTILRSRCIYGPYEDKIVLHQGHTDVNGPHQGGYVDDEADAACRVRRGTGRAYRIRTSIPLHRVGVIRGWPADRARKLQPMATGYFKIYSSPESKID